MLSGEWKTERDGSTVVLKDGRFEIIPANENARKLTGTYSVTDEGRVQFVNDTDMTTAPGAQAEYKYSVTGNIATFCVVDEDLDRARNRLMSTPWTKVA